MARTLVVLADVVGEAGRRWGSSVAYVAPSGWRLTYQGLDQLSDEVAGGLAARGVGVGDVVALAMPPWPEFVVAYAAAAKLGAVTAGINDRLTPAERAACLDAVGASVVLDASNVVAASSDSSCLPELRVGGFVPPALPPDPARPVAIVFTSGTTGAPKGAVYAGRQLDAITRVDTGWTWGGGGAGMAGTTFAHLGPMTKLPGTLVRGGTTHVLERWRPADALALIARERMAGIGGIPTQVALMLADPGFSSHDLSCVRAVIMGGGPATPALVRAARAGFGAAVATRYSCTEAGVGTGTAFDAPPEDAEVSVGRPQPGVTLLVVDPSGAPVPAGRGEVGEVCFRSDAVMSGYWGAPAATAAAFTPDGAVRTGDLGWVDDEGRLRLAGRAKEMYVRGGENVFPQEVEAVLSDAPGVGAVVIVPRPDDTWGEVGVAVVVPSGPTAVTLASLRSHGSARLAPFKLPEDLLLIDALPLTPMEKVDRRELSTRVRR
jgi:acyl-CoA synthetase (AMP-forming)/AMP-acid ligase II